MDVELLRAWSNCLGPDLSSKMDQPAPQRKKSSSHYRWCPGPYQLLWKFLPLDERHRVAFLTMGELRTYVLFIYGTLLIKLVFFVCLILWHISHQLVAPFISACMAGCSDFKS